MAALLSAPSKSATMPPTAVGKDQALVWTSWATLLALVVFALCSGQVYAPPVARLTEPEALTRAERLLERLRPADLSGVPLAAYQRAGQCQRHPVDLARWEFAFLAPDRSHLYRLTLNATGDFRYFAVYRRRPAVEAAAAFNEAAVRQQSEVWRDFLRAEAGITPVPVTEAPPPVRESPFPGSVRDILRRWKTDHAQWAFVEVSFDQQGLQSLGVTPAETPRPTGGSVWGGVLVIGFLALVFWLPWLLVFVRGIARREMGSLTTLVTSGVLATLLMLWLTTLLGVTLVTHFAWLNPSISEEGFVVLLSDAGYRWVIFFITLLVAAGVSLGALGVGLVSLAVTESYDWKRQRQLLGDVYRLTRRGGLTPLQMLRLSVGSVALASWVLALETGVQWITGQPLLPWHEFAVWSQSLAIGRWPGWKIIGECLADVWLMTIWLLPLVAFARDRLQDRSTGLAVGVLLGLMGLPFVIGDWAMALGYALLVTGLVWALLNYGWLAVVFGQLLVGGLFPLLWGLRFPNGFEPAFLLGGMLIILPLGFLIGFRRPARRLRKETFDLAPRYIRDRLRLERWREDREVRWLIHCNLLPPSGFRDERQRVLAEYAHLPEQGQEWFIVLPLGPERIGVGIGEVSGQELQASLLVAIVLAAIRSKAAHYADCPAQVIERLNDFLSPRLRAIGSQVRLLYGIADFRTGEFIYCNAGYVAPVVLRPRAGEKPSPSSLTGARNSALDGRTDLRFTENRVCLERGSRVVLMSDWLAEVQGLESDAPDLASRYETLLASLDEPPEGNLPRAVIDYARERLQPPPGESFAKSPAETEITVVCLTF
ncbi:PP2C family protein-serine/threonine phosphatase [Chloracidobacterium aggregatum]|uniref:SpoIIE family protein phosphatase n=1 Tax=Chloracidobacterium sp. N TaxID=2821540 RepID=A0ABX8AZH3_9BACT|nr:PP2C family protein-serine/threonine phosphatase [Chloracidobacterium aggregatum]QUV87993.1 SpoIIE family protein phosphatase [Chloracidobacterium sp. S]QUV90913.1 SpoIIE family protein phosphatase [Chloracidobacterium sp. A]QUV94103.1 SpoIIE family protein phosphatase [Chloracidobacterium sp. N]QUV97300.1 SpoIIE family protein phosphatase [Chloracidobacterium sp. E]